MNVGIVGASGYSGEVLVKLLLAHPRVTLAAVTSRTHAGKPLSAVIPAVRGVDRGLKFVDSDPAALAASDVALFFLALPHGAAATYAQALVAAGHGTITTDIEPLTEFFYAEDYHQQYLAKNPGGYCGLGGTGVACPVGLSTDAPPATAT